MLARSGQRIASVRVDSAAAATWIFRGSPRILRRSLADADWHRSVSVLGSTGSIGTQTLDFARARPDRFSVVALCAGANYELLAAQARAPRGR